MMEYLDRFGVLAGILLLVGVVAFQLIVLPRARLSETAAAMCTRAAARVGLVAAIVLLAVVAARLDFQVRGLQFPGDSWLSVAGPLLNATSWGVVWYFQLALSLLAVISFVGVARGASFARKLAAITTLILAATPALSGHAMSNAASRGLLVPADILHVIGAGTWTGTLAILLIAGVVPLRRSQAIDANISIASLVISFSPLAQASAAVVVVSGTIAAWKHLHTISAMFSSTYGRVLIAKLAIVGIVAALGFVNWKRVTPRIADDGPGQLAKSASREVFAATIVLIITAALIATPQPVMR